MIYRYLNQLKHFLFAWFSYWYYGRPARKLIVIGVTGTKGKSTACRFIASVLEAAGFSVGLMTTVEFQIADKRWMNDKKMTMLGKGQIQKMLDDMVKAGCQYAVIETSSEGILQYRHYGLLYDVSVFTNLGAEHSERHGGFENLKRDKGKIFAELMKHSRKKLNGRTVPKVIVANGDDTHASYYLSFPADEKWVYGRNVSSIEYQVASAVVASDMSIGDTGTQFTVLDRHFLIQLVGEFNVYNALAAIAVGRSQNISDEHIARGLAEVRLVEGRMEFIDEGQSFTVIVDYAHEPLSLTELFKSLRTLGQRSNGRIISVVGSDGGGRDKGKREKMGEIAGRMTDIVVITDVNCFDEDPHQIAEMLAVGARKAGKKDNKNLFIEVDRRQGIEKAIGLARGGDIVVITAKGTEPCIVVAGGTKIPWDDRRVTREILRAKT